MSDQPPLTPPTPGAVPAPFPHNERERLKALRAYEILDTPPEEIYDDLVFIASAICQTPIALLSLVDEHRQFIKANVGLEVKETPRDIAFCAHSILGKEPLVVEDATADARFATNPLVTGEPAIRFYAGVPLVNAEGLTLGTLCAIDRTPRELTPDQARAMKALARQVVTQLELRRTLVMLRATLAEAASRDTPAPVSQIRPPNEIVSVAERARALIAEGVSQGKMEGHLRLLLARIEELQSQTRTGR